MIYDSFDHLGKQRNHLFFCEKKQQHSLFIPFRASCTDAQKTQQAMPHPIAIGVLLFEFSTWRCRYLSSELQRVGFSWPCACWLIIILSYYLDIIFMLLNIISYTTSYYYIYSGNLVANKSFTAPKLYCIQSFLGANKFASLLNHNICIRFCKEKHQHACFNNLFLGLYMSSNSNLPIGQIPQRWEPNNAMAASRSSLACCFWSSKRISLDPQLWWKNHSLDYIQ